MTDSLTTLTFPTFAQGPDDPPPWVSQRGQDVRAYDLGSERLVWGPSHVFEAPDDCVLTNGVIRATFGALNSPPEIFVEAFADGEWRDLGSVYFANPASSSEIVQRVRLSKLTPDVGTAVIETRALGPVHVTLKRGERMFRIVSGSDIDPTDSRARRVQWDTAPSGALSSGLIVGAATAEGLIRGLAVLDNAYTQVSGGVFGVQRTAESIEVGVFVATSASFDQTDDHHEQYAGESEQQIRFR